MGTRRGKLAGMCATVMLALGLAACSSASGSPSATAVVTPRLVTPTPIGGAPGSEPMVISSPTPIAGSKISSQKIVLSDRTLIINSVTSQRAASTNSILIDLDIVVQNTSGKAIRNEEAFFALVATGGDIFRYQDNSSDTFYETIGAHASRSGVIEFKIPASAALGLYLLYRPEMAKETVLTRLKIA